MKNRFFMGLRNGLIISLMLWGLIFFTIKCFAEDIYEKISDTEFKKVVQISEKRETIYSISELHRRKEGLQKVIKNTEKKLAEIEALIIKAQELGIKEEVIVEPIEIVEPIQ